MFAPRDYLVVEFENVNRTLTETLRFRYADEHLQPFYEECTARLKYVQGALAQLDAQDRDGTREIAIQISQLSDLITRIERSHLEEFSWPFASALQRISTEVCREGAPFEDPLFFFTADGGIGSYAVRREAVEPGFAQTKIYVVNFPRSLKELVLLHTIIGHEIGHAAYATTPISRQLGTIASALIRGSPVADGKTLYAWCKKHMNVQHEVNDHYLAGQRKSWTEEFFCDLFGLIVMGPAFLPAFQSLLESMAGRKAFSYVPSHPPFTARLVALVTAADELGLLYSKGRRSHLAFPLDQEYLKRSKELRADGHALLKDQHVRSAARKLKAFLRRFKGLAFSAPDFTVIGDQMKCLQERIPPVGNNCRVQKGKPLIEVQSLDFRHILLAGWLMWMDRARQSAGNADTTFYFINQLCSHAIMQQEGLRWWEEHPVDVP